MKRQLLKISVAPLILALLAACGDGGATTTALPHAYAAKRAAAADKRAPAVEGCTVELYGDSIMAGNGSPETPAMTLQRLRPGLQVVADRSAPGTTLAMIYPDFANQPRSARFVVIENGVIDAWQGAPLDRLLNTYSVMAEQLRAEGRVPVLTGYSRQLPGGSIKGGELARRDPYDAALHAFADESGIAFADWGAVPFEGQADLLDTVHPNKRYSDRLVQQLAGTLDALAPECVAGPAAAG